MDEQDLRKLLDRLGDGQIGPDEVLTELARLPFADLGHAKIDHHRGLRQGMPEAVYGPGKTPEQCVDIVAELLTNGSGPVLITRTNADQVAALDAAHPGARRGAAALLWRPATVRPERVVVATAGTADSLVAEECALTLLAHGVEATRLNDVGVAGLHRLLASLDQITEADVVVVVAGMEGALASVIGGLTASPVIAVPTSVGYGSSLDGITALLSMHASCASGIAVVGIDNGFGAACAAMRTLNAGGKHG